jgi:hypothetical protein
LTHAQTFIDNTEQLSIRQTPMNRTYCTACSAWNATMFTSLRSRQTRSNETFTFQNGIERQ